MNSTKQHCKIDNIQRSVDEQVAMLFAIVGSGVLGVIVAMTFGL